tara:strand:- start:26 stop:586 length:561 start_codon:yes stop_codon:yes gene_type:complete
MNKGFISLNREMLDHWLWAEKRKFSKAEAWIDLLMSANYAEIKVLIKGKLIVCKRGDTIQSLETLGSRWGWKRDAVRRFLKLLENDNMIRYANAMVTSHISICKYDTYQSQQNPIAQKVRRTCDGRATDARTNNKENKENKEKGEDFVFYGIDIRTLNQKTLEGKKRTLDQLKQVAQFQSQGHPIN